MHFLISFVAKQEHTDSIIGEWALIAAGLGGTDDFFQFQHRNSLKGFPFASPINTTFISWSNNPPCAILSLRMNLPVFFFFLLSYDAV